MNFCTLFLKTENVHLMKDVGQLPLCLKDDFGYHAYIATYKNGEYPYLEREAKGLEVQFVKKSILGRYFDGIRYIFINRKKIDVLNVYHLNLSSFLWIAFFKFVRKKGAISYLKLDANHFEIGKMQKRNPTAFIKHLTIKNADIVSAESTIMKEALQKYCRREILYIPNGYIKTQSNEQTINYKENIILTVGRLGTYSKATELLVDAFIHAKISPQWKLVLAGPMTEGFAEWVEERMQRHPAMHDRILMAGLIEDKSVLRKWYQRAKIFILPSRVESFGIVLIEALLAGDYLITSDTVLAAEDLIQDSNMGMIFPGNSVEKLEKALEEATALDIDWDKNAKQIIRSVEDKFLWTNILQTLDRRIRTMWGE